MPKIDSYRKSKMYSLLRLR